MQNKQKQSKTIKRKHGSFKGDNKKTRSIVMGNNFMHKRITQKDYKYKPPHLYQLGNTSEVSSIS